MRHMTHAELARSMCHWCANNVNSAARWRVRPFDVTTSKAHRHTAAAAAEGGVATDTKGQAPGVLSDRDELPYHTAEEIGHVPLHERWLDMSRRRSELQRGLAGWVRSVAAARRLSRHAV